MGSAWVSTPLVYQRHRRAARYQGNLSVWPVREPSRGGDFKDDILLPDISATLAGSSVETGRVMKGIDEKLTADWQWPVTRESMRWLRPGTFSE